MENIENIKKPKTFKDYYQDPIFRQRHKEKLYELGNCSCGCIVMKANMTRHKNSYKHKIMMEKKELKPECILNDLKTLTDEQIKTISEEIKKILNIKDIE